MQQPQHLPRKPRSNSPQISRRALARAGFTLLEMMIVVTIILILLSLGSGLYIKSVLRSKEAALKQDLFVMRQAIEQYTLDKQTAPQSLEDLVSSGYLREIPTDPITRAKDWQVEYENVVLSPDQSGTGISNVHSGSSTISPFENTQYSTW